MKMQYRLLLLEAVLSLCACAAPKPWQKGTLAKESMTFGHSRLQVAFDEHIYSSRESSTGGASLGGGGCGCN